MHGARASFPVEFLPRSVWVGIGGDPAVERGGPDRDPPTAAHRRRARLCSAPSGMRERPGMDAWFGLRRRGEMAMERLQRIFGLPDGATVVGLAAARFLQAGLHLLPRAPQET
ncbi:unnamed protein product [Urochloa humidicola]